jgi:glycosyltransferase involved in cell wall biosynthesis
MKKKRLLIASDSFLPRWDGIARFLSELIPYIKDKYEVKLVVPQFKGKQVSYKNVKITRIKTHNFQVGDFTPAKFEFNKIRKNVKEADIVWTQTIGPIGASAIYFAKKLKKKVISYIHSIEWELVSASISNVGIIKKVSYPITKKLARYLYNKCDLLIVPSMEVANILKRNKIKTRKVIVNLGVNFAKFIPPIDKNKAKRKVNVNPRLKVIGFCGRIAREKDLPTLHKAFSELSKKYNNLLLLIIGKGIEEKELLQQENIKLVGSTDDVLPYLQAMDIYILPSLTETSSLSTMEAMSCGLAVVSTPVGYTKRYIKENYNGYFFPKGDYKALTKILNKLLKDDNLRQRLGQRARREIVFKHGWNKTVREIEQIIHKF